MPPKKGSKQEQNLRCSECDKSYAKPGYLAKHMATLHPSVKAANGTKRKPVVKLSSSGFKTADGMLLLEDADGNLWLAERLR